MPLMSKVVTANKLTSGTVVFYGADGRWVDTIGEAYVFDDMPSAEAGLLYAKRDEARALVVDPFIVDQTPGADGRTKMSLRDTIRAYGPTIVFVPADETIAR